MNAQQIRTQIARLKPKAESGEQWAEICALEEQLVKLEPKYTYCDICDERPGTHEIAWGGVRCDECREHAVI